MATYAVVLAGGGGTRLWPLSRPDRPKPFLAPLGGASLLQRTVDRLAPLVGPSDVFIVTDGRYAELVREQLPDLPAGNIVAEPAGRNTAPAIALATLAIDRQDGDVMLVLPADHLVIDEAGFRRVLSAAAEAAAGRAGVADPLVTLGIRPTGPETGFGYIVAGPSAVSPDPGAETGAPAAREVLRFVEKPDAVAAAALFAGDPPASWNAGIFVWRRRAIRDALERHATDIVETVAGGLGSERAGHAGALAAAYGMVRATSIDYAVMEPAAAEGDVLVVPADVGWSDLGSWSAIRDALFAQARAVAPQAAGARGRQAAEGVGPDGPGRMGAGADEPGRVGAGPGEPATVGAGPRRDIDSTGTLVLADGRLVVTIGLRDTIVVDTPDAVLVCAADRSQEVRSIAEDLARRAEEGT